MTPKDKGGRPLKFKSVKALESAIEEYFEWCDNRTKKVWDEKKGTEYMIADPAPYTMSGLARRIGIDRRTLLDYSKRSKFLPTIKKARERIHEDVETRLMEKAPTGAIFNLKNNFGWTDETKQKQEITGGIEVKINDYTQHNPTAETEDSTGQK